MIAITGIVIMATTTYKAIETIDISDSWLYSNRATTGINTLRGSDITYSIFSFFKKKDVIHLLKSYIFYILDNIQKIDHKIVLHIASSATCY